MALKVDYKDYEFQPGQTLRRYRLITNDDGTVSLEDVTQYGQVGDNYKADDINGTNKEVNSISDKLKTALFIKS